MLLFANATKKLDVFGQDLIELRALIRLRPRFRGDIAGANKASVTYISGTRFEHFDSRS